MALVVSCTAHIAQDGLSAAIYVLMPVLAQAFGFTYAEVGLIKGLAYPDGGGDCTPPLICGAPV